MMRTRKLASMLLAPACAASMVAATALAAPPGSDGQAIPPEVLAKIQAARAAASQNDGDKEFPPFEEVAKDYEKVVTTSEQPWYSLWTRKKDGSVLAELPRGFEGQRFLLAYTVAKGTPFAGIQLNDLYVYWKRYGDKLALIEPNLAVRTSGDRESAAGLNRVFTDRVILSVPIVTMGPSGQPVIDIDDMLVGQATKFFGMQARGIQKDLTEISKAKAFPENVEIGFKVPAADGRLTEYAYSWRNVPKDRSFKPREADSRVGYFTTSYLDIGDPSDDTPYTRYINRWKLEKADPSLQMSPPKEPIVFYIEHTTPIRYRRWVRDGVLEWNKAYEKVGISNAIEVYQQDIRTGAHMDKDPEDARYNFINWTNAPIGFAIGPSRAHPETGQILDADVVMSEGFIRGWVRQWRQVIPEQAMEGFGPDVLAWLEQNPKWDPRLRFAAPAEQERMLQERRIEQATRGVARYGGHPAANADPTLLGDDPYDGLADRVSQTAGYCALAKHRTVDVAMFRLAYGLLQDAELLSAASDDGQSKTDRKKKLEEIEFPPGMPEELKREILAKMAEAMEAEEDIVEEHEQVEEQTKKVQTTEKGESLIDGVPESFIGPLLMDVVMHEVGHVLGLRHNFNASTIYSLEEMNSEGFGDQAYAGSVMDYNPININFGDGEAQGPWTMMTVGPYDYFAIEYGYTDGKLDEVLKKSADPKHTYNTDEDTWGPDPRARRFDLGADPLDYSDSTMRLVQHLRPKIIEKIVKEGDSWSKARDAYQLMLSRHIGAVSIAANWVGGSYVNRVTKGGPSDRDPIEDVSVDQQRRALQFVIDNAFRDDSFGLSEELLRKMTVDKWWDAGGMNSIFEDPTWDVHDTILAIQNASLTMVMNPTTLRRVFDNEFRIPSSEDAVTLPEVVNSIADAIWSELGKRVDRRYTAREPMISSLRRNLQREHLERLIDLTKPEGLTGAAAKPIQTLATHRLRSLSSKLESVLEQGDSKLDPYTVAHLSESHERIRRALQAIDIYNANEIGGGVSFILFGEPQQAQPE